MLLFISDELHGQEKEVGCVSLRKPDKHTMGRPIYATMFKASR